MPTNNSQVKFKYITQNSTIPYPADDNTIYFKEYDGSIQIGNKQFGVSKNEPQINNSISIVKPLETSVVIDVDALENTDYLILQGENSNPIIRNVHDPINAQDAATKNYIDNKQITNFNGVLSIEHGGTGNADGYIRTGTIVPCGFNATAEGGSTESIENWMRNTTIKNVNQIHKISEKVYAFQSIDEDQLAIDIGYYLYNINNNVKEYAMILDYSFSNGEWTVILNKNLSSSLSNTCYLSEEEWPFTIASGDWSHAESYGTTASGSCSHAEGAVTFASGNCSHAEGRKTTASGFQSHAEGNSTIAFGNFSHTEGSHTIAQRKSQHVFGEYNIVDGIEESGVSKGNYIEIVGNGTNNENRSNARTLDWNGNEVLAGKLTIGTTPTTDMDVTNKSYVDALKPLIIELVGNGASFMAMIAGTATSITAAEIYATIPNRTVLCTYNNVYYPLTYCSSTIAEFGYYNDTNDNAKISINTSGTATVNISV